MKKTILITGATDGIGFETAKKLAAQDHSLLLHGRSAGKLQQVKEALLEQFPQAKLDIFLADLSDLDQVVTLANQVKANYSSIDVLINNAGVYKVPKAMAENGLDVRFVVNTLAPYVLTKALLPLMGAKSRVVNLSSAAQASVNLEALQGRVPMSDSEAYAQSKLAITMWSFQLANAMKNDATAIIAVNPASFLGSKMVKQAYGSDGKDLGIGADILIRAALSDEFADCTGRYFDNDIGRWAQPHPDALNKGKNDALVNVMDELLGQFGIQR
ncbi:SDR family NAD(P)-dependent oxidoreductase [Marinomonas sp. TW1]|uniref:SDR family NAD(P)-dependent oxidoreductase n=1 Tax=Marinomonas sp. TW1 TaxID=1561203 RepID=UPI0007AF2638|nr:SDR family NAD(P)-dependent oxidoreductase [Marinomonas sp. TW1]KZN13550.1 oxidoreductase [Marinomonas sp. TW1]